MKHAHLPGGSVEVNSAETGLHREGDDPTPNPQLRRFRTAPSETETLWGMEAPLRTGPDAPLPSQVADLEELMGWLWGCLGNDRDEEPNCPVCLHSRTSRGGLLVRHRWRRHG